MSFELKSGASADLQTVDPTSKAGRVTLYDSAGNKIVPEYTGSYMLRVDFAPSAVTAGLTLWAMRNLGTKRVFIRSIDLQMGWTTTTAAAARSIFDLQRFSAATPTTGTALTVVKADNTHTASSVTDARFNNAGLTTTSVVFEATFANFGVTHSNAAPLNLNPRYDTFGERSRLVLAANEGLCIRQVTVLPAVGAWIAGSIAWDELT